MQKASEFAAVIHKRKRISKLRCLLRILLNERHFNDDEEPSFQPTENEQICAHDWGNADRYRNQ